MSYIPRAIAPQLRTYLTIFRVVYIVGARQVGKTTLAQHEGGSRRFISLDDPTVLRQCAADPVGFLRSFGDDDLLIDEVQRVPELMLAIEREADADERPGRFLVTGSAEARATANLQDSLAGRLGALELRPLSQAEIEVTATSVLEQLTAVESPTWQSASERGLIDYLPRMMGGGYPPALAAPAVSRPTWLRSYVDGVLSRDVRELVGVEDVGRLRRVFGLIAASSGQLLKKSSIARDAELAKATASTWVDLLKATHLIDVLPGWGGSRRSRVVRMPKVFINDTGVLCAALRADAETALRDPTLAGALAETFVVQELLRHASYQTGHSFQFHHYRDRDQREIDLIIEGEDGGLFAIEVKASASCSPRDARHIEALGGMVGDRLRRGIVFYCGEHPQKLTDRVIAVPMANLWA